MVLADIGYGEIEPFRDAFPERFYNCGVAEQNMTGVACGVAMEGNIAVTYSIANFPTLRCLEQIRNDVCYHNANVKIVIIGGGLAYGPLGVSHQATEDIAIMRALPNMVVVCPCDFAEAEAGVHAMIAHDGPFYYRCGYKKEPAVHAGPIEFQLGKALQVQDGDALTIIGTGTIVNQAHAAVQQLAAEGIHVPPDQHAHGQADRPRGHRPRGPRDRRHPHHRGAPAAAAASARR
jgi:transketolase